MAGTAPRAPTTSGTSTTTATAQAPASGEMRPAKSRLGWKMLPLVVGSACMLAGAWLVATGWGSAVGGAGVTATSAGMLGLGVLVGLFGLLTVLGPHLAPLLYRLYGPEAFSSRAAACPVVAKCARCSEFNFRGKPVCKSCGTTLEWGAKAAA